MANDVRRKGGNIFDDQIRVGVAVWFCVKHHAGVGCRIFYEAVRDYAKAGEKRDFLRSTPLSERRWHEVTPDENHNWINISDTHNTNLIPIGSKKTKAARSATQERAIFKLFSLGIVTARDGWAYDADRAHLEEKVNRFFTVYDTERIAWEKRAADYDLSSHVSREIKWTTELEYLVKRNVSLTFDRHAVRLAAYRPFVKRYTYYARHFTHRMYQQEHIFSQGQNRAFVTDVSGKPFSCLAIDVLPDYHLDGDANTFAIYRYVDGKRIDNITDWALDQFAAHYGSKVAITKDDIFHYVYAVLHDPVYRETYALNLRREFPGIPFYPEFARWAAWGKALMDLHIGYETVEPWSLTRVDVPMRGGAPLKKGRSKDLFEEPAKPSAKKEADTPKVRLRADKDLGVVELDAQTQLTGVPAEAWTYRLGNRSAIEWVLDQHREKRPSDPTIREKFDTYRFADHKEKVIDLLGRVTRVSVETMAIIEEMKAAER